MTHAAALLVLLVQWPPTDSTRQRAPVDAWRFQLGDPPDAARVDFDDSSWSAVRTPHTWNALDGQDGGNNYYRGPAWYRTRVQIPGGRRGEQRFFLRFGAAALIADVYVNGRVVGNHRGGFAAFCFEVTEHVALASSAGDLTLAVRVDNSPNADIAPLSGDFTVFGGLYRPVELLITDSICISPLDHASSGVYLTQSQLSAAQATIDTRVLVSNGTSAATEADVICTALDADGNPVANATSQVSAAGGSTVTAKTRLVILRPRRWQGRDDPYLYTLRVEVRVAGRTVDRLDQPLGLRTFRVDRERGFFLNDVNYPLYGVNRHQDRQDKGWAASNADIEEDFAILRELGCTAVRLAHYQHDDLAYSLADQAGLVVWAEIPLIDAITDSPAFCENACEQLCELIRQNYNHPSICFWGIHNEVTAPWKSGPDPTELVRQLHELAKAEDPQRLTTCAATNPDEHPANWQTDVTAFNRYFGWYVGEPDEFGPWADRVHAAHPRTPLGISEYGAGASIHQHAWPPEKPQHDGPFHPEEWQAHLHRAHWRAMRERPFLWCNLVWNGFDFASDGRNEGDTPGRNDKGLVTYDRRQRKEAFLAYQALWSKEPFIQIACRGAGVPDAPLRIYTNCESVTLFVDGIEHGTRPARDNLVDWPGDSLATGPHVLRAIGRRGGISVQTQCAVAQPSSAPHGW